VRGVVPGSGVSRSWIYEHKEGWLPPRAQRRESLKGMDVRAARRALPHNCTAAAGPHICQPGQIIPPQADPGYLQNCPWELFPATNVGHPKSHPNVDHYLPESILPGHAILAISQVTGPRASSP
jgi:hypothetical protein